MVHGAEFQMQGIKFVPNFFMLGLIGSNVIVRMQLLRILGLVLWDFNIINMKFEENKKSIVLKGLNHTQSDLVDVAQIYQLTTIERK